MIENKVIDVSDLSPKQIAIIKEIIANFKLVAQQNDLTEDIITAKPKNSEKSLNLAQRIRQRFIHLENVEIPQITRDKMRTPPQFD